MPPSSHFSQYFPLVIDSLMYGIYLVLFLQSVQSLLSRRCASYKFHLGCMTLLFLLSTIHVIIAWAWAFTTDTATTAIYEVFSLKNPLPQLYGPNDPASVHRYAPLIKALYTIANTIADGIILYRCYVIWGYNWRAIVAPGVAYVGTVIGGIVAVLPLSGDSERAALAVCIGTTFFTNVLATTLAAGRIWWICRRAAYVNRTSHRKYFDITAILLESGLVYPAVLIVTVGVFLAPATSTESVLVCMAVLYHIVGIAPTLIIVRVGMGVSTDDVDKCVTLSRGTNPSTGMTGLRAAPAPRDTMAMSLRLRARHVDVDVDMDPEGAQETESLSFDNQKAPRTLTSV
ncbi:hypothetical protein GGX14DRAFT_483660 [Mycena pura]|uniref:Uncharacterized protein n=1 Tax=Mycena pura TaxID=153505 RepID=A0AAD6Y1J3_9AGAR|nr:hypothetical protein GGX14DRAFT_483660 [Mycena pura]